MKKWMFFSAVLLFGWQTANALIVSVDEYGEVPVEGMEITYAKTEKDPFTEKNVMELKGDLLCSGSLVVTITRSSEALVDEFCCATQCTTGNGTKGELLSFTTNGVTSWYTHYTPSEKSHETINYIFSDGTEIRTLTVHYVYDATSDDIPESFPKKHLIEEFTGQDCGYCPDGMDAVSTFMKNDDDWVLILHHYGFAPDKFSIDGSKTITDLLGVHSAPSASIDRKETKCYSESSILFHPANLSGVKKSQFETTTYASVEIQNTYDAESRKLNVHVSGAIAKADYPALKLTVLVKESGMIDYQADYYATFEGWEQFRHAHAVRAFLTDALGDNVTIDGTRHYATELSITLNKTWMPVNCMVVAFLSEDFNPVVQVAEQPVVEGSKGGADIEHEGIKAVPVEDFYPEPSATAAPKDYSHQDSEELATAWAECTAYSKYGFNYWQIIAYSTKRTLNVDNVVCLPYARINLFTDLSQTILPNGTYTFSSSQMPGTAEAGVRDDAIFYVGGSQFYFTSKEYFNNGYLVPKAQWLIAEGTLTITDKDWSVQAKARNGKDIVLRGTSPINYDGKQSDLESVTSQSTQIVKILQNGQLLIQHDGEVYNILGTKIK